MIKTCWSVFKCFNILDKYIIVYRSALVVCKIHSLSMFEFFQACRKNVVPACSRFRGSDISNLQIAKVM